MIQEMEPDLALLDVKMPGLDGIEVARELKGSSTVVAVSYTHLPKTPKPH